MARTRKISRQRGGGPYSHLSNINLLREKSVLERRITGEMGKNLKDRILREVKLIEGEIQRRTKGVAAAAPAAAAAAPPVPNVGDELFQIEKGINEAEAALITNGMRKLRELEMEKNGILNAKGKYNSVFSYGYERTLPERAKKTLKNTRARRTRPETGNEVYFQYGPAIASKQKRSTNRDYENNLRNIDEEIGAIRASGNGLNNDDAVEGKKKEIEGVVQKIRKLLPTAKPLTTWEKVRYGPSNLREIKGNKDRAAEEVKVLYATLNGLLGELKMARAAAGVLPPPPASPLIRSIPIAPEVAARAREEEARAAAEQLKRAEARWENAGQGELKAAVAAAEAREAEERAAAAEADEEEEEEDGAAEEEGEGALHKGTEIVDKFLQEQGSPTASHMQNGPVSPNASTVPLWPRRTTELTVPVAAHWGPKSYAQKVWNAALARRNALLPPTPSPLPSSAPAPSGVTRSGPTPSHPTILSQLPPPSLSPEVLRAAAESGSIHEVRGALESQALRAAPAIQPRNSPLPHPPPGSASNTLYRALLAARKEHPGTNNISYRDFGEKVARFANALANPTRRGGRRHPRSHHRKTKKTHYRSKETHRRSKETHRRH